MSWNKKRSIRIPKPTPINYIKWFSIFLAALFFSFIFLYSNINNNLPNDNKIINLLIAFTPLIMTTLAFITILILYISKKNKYLFLENEKLYADEQWAIWGSRKMSVLGSVTLLPKNITLPYIMQHQAQHEACYNTAKSIDYIQPDHTSSYILLRSLNEKIHFLSENFPFQIKYITRRNKSSIINELTSAWSELFDNSIPSLGVSHEFSYEYIDRSIKENKDIIELIIIEQEYNRQQSAALSAIIITTDDIAKKYGVDVVASINRPMPILDSENYTDTIDLFAEIQVSAQFASTLYFDGKISSSLLSDIYQSTITLKNISPSTSIDLEYFIGLTGEYSPWINTIVAIEFVTQFKKNALTLSKEKETTFISTITVG